MDKIDDGYYGFKKKKKQWIMNFYKHNFLFSVLIINLKSFKSFRILY